MAQQITRTVTVRIWADKGKRLPKSSEVTDKILDEEIAHAARMIGDGFRSGQITEQEFVNGWWEVSDNDER